MGIFCVTLPRLTSRVNKWGQVLKNRMGPFSGKFLRGNSQSVGGLSPWVKTHQTSSSLSLPTHFLEAVFLGRMRAAQETRRNLSCSAVRHVHRKKRSTLNFSRYFPVVALCELSKSTFRFPTFSTVWIISLQQLSINEPKNQNPSSRPSISVVASDNFPHEKQTKTSWYYSTISAAHISHQPNPPFLLL